MAALTSCAVPYMEGVNRVAVAQGREAEELNNELQRLHLLCSGSQEQSGAAAGAGDAAARVVLVKDHEGADMARWEPGDRMLFTDFQWQVDYWGALPVTAGMSEAELFGTEFSSGGAQSNEARRDEARAWGQAQDVELSHRLHVSVQAWLRPCGLIPARRCSSTSCSLRGRLCEAVYAVPACSTCTASPVSITDRPRQ